MSEEDFSENIIEDREYLRNEKDVVEILKDRKIRSSMAFEIDDNGFIYLPLSEEEFIYVYAFCLRDAFKKIKYLYTQYPLIKAFKKQTKEKYPYLFD